MMILAVSPLGVVTTIGLVALSLAVGLCLWRLALGPTLADRVVALDLMAILLVGGLVLFGLEKPRTEPLRVATVLALMNFLGTVGFAIYLQRKANDE